LELLANVRGFLDRFSSPLSPHFSNFPHITTYQKCFHIDICTHLPEESKNEVKMYHSKNSIIPFIVYYNIGIRKLKQTYTNTFPHSPQKRVHIFSLAFCVFILKSRTFFPILFPIALLFFRHFQSLFSPLRKM
jgi:hypothetical protein